MFKLHLLDAATSFLVSWQEGVRAAAEAAGSSAAARHGLHEQRRRLVAQCAERLAEYRHLCHAAQGSSSSSRRRRSASGSTATPDFAYRVGQALAELEVRHTADHPSSRP